MSKQQFSIFNNRVSGYFRGGCGSTHGAQRGFTVIIATLVSTVVLAIGLAILSLTLRQLSLAGIARESEIAFQAANAGMECIRYYDVSDSDGGTFDVPGDGSSEALNTNFECFGESQPDDSSGSRESGTEQRFEWTWNGGGAGQTCSIVSIYKFFNDSDDEDVIVEGEELTDFSPCPEDVECTVVKARGYNAACGNYSGEVVERELTLIY